MMLMNYPGKMNKRIIQLRGLNASGKSTAMRQFAQIKGLKESQIDVCGIKTWIMTNEDTAVIGRYPKESNFGGCDSCIKGKQHLFDTLQTLMNQGYETICFEGYLFSGSAKLCIEVDNIAKSNGYEYIALLMDLSYNTELDRLFQRNGGKDINLNAFDSGRKAVYKSHSLLKNKGIITMIVDSENTANDKMGEAILNVIRGY